MEERRISSIQVTGEKIFLPSQPDGRIRMREKALTL